MEKVIVTAANGFLGESLIRFLKLKYEVVAMVRGEVQEVSGIRYVKWDGKSLGSWQAEFEGAKAILNFAGRSVDCRYTEKNKGDIYSSRLESTEVIGQAIDLCIDKPKIWINSASATIYAHSEDLPNTEDEGVIGDGFSVDVCKKWEQSFFEYTYTNVRQIALRTTIVLGKKGGAYPVYRKLVKCWMGGKQGDGKQMFSWIHIDDFLRAIVFLMEETTLSGPVNMSSPLPEKNAVMMKKMRDSLGVKIGVPQSKWLLKLGAWIVQTETELILKSRFVLPDKLMNAGFKFEYPTIEEAFKSLA